MEGILIIGLICGIILILGVTALLLVLGTWASSYLISEIVENYKDIKKRMK